MKAEAVGINDLISALTLAKKGLDGYGLKYPTQCSHDQLTLIADPTKFTAEEITQMKEWGFEVATDGDYFYSFRFGSC